MNIDGKWIGYYEYGEGYQLPFFGERIKIEVNFLEDNDGNIEGSIIEESSELSIPSDSTLKGFVDQNLISFIRTYPVKPKINNQSSTIEIENGILEVTYAGIVDQENNAIYGNWSISQNSLHKNEMYDCFNFLCHRKKALN